MYKRQEVEKSDRGTDIVLHMDEEHVEYLEEAKIEALLNKYCKFLPVPIVFEMCIRDRIQVPSGILTFEVMDISV